MRPVVGVDKQDHSNPSPFELRVYDHVNKIEIDGKIVFDPIDYFITSGDAIQKTIAMIKIIDKRIISMNEEDDNNNLCEKYIECIDGAKSMLKLLEDVKGSACFLETEWDDHSLNITPKNPRAK